MNQNQTKVKTQALWTALITPFDQQGKVNFGELEKLIKLQEEAGNGLLILGSTGESLNLDLSCAKEIVEFVNKLTINIPLMCGVGGINLKETAAWVSYLETFENINCYLMVTPLYAKPGDQGQYEWFKTLMEISSKPVCLYNVPGRCGQSLSKVALEKLKSHTQFWSVKEASGSVAEFKQYVEIVGEAGVVFSGDDAMLPAFSEHGAAGLVSVASNVWPKQIANYVDQCLSKKLQQAELWGKCCNQLFIQSNPIPVKVLMQYLGIISSAVLLPPLTEQEITVENKQSLIEADLQINELNKN